MPTRTITALLLIVSLLACGADGKEKATDKPKAAGQPKVAEEAKGKGEKAKDGNEKAKKDEKPACMHCGATCGLVPICVCEPGTKKKPKVEFDVQCEPICVAGCDSRPWLLGRRHHGVECTGCCEEPCRCPGWVKNCKKLKKETTDEEVPVIKRKVAYVCECCAGRCTAGCCGVGRLPGSSSWWNSLTSWMTRMHVP